MLPNNWREEVRKKIGSTPWDQVVEDIRPFIASPVELGLLTKENLLNLIK